MKNLQFDKGYFNINIPHLHTCTDFLSEIVDENIIDRKGGKHLMNEVIIFLRRKFVNSF